MKLWILVLTLTVCLHAVSSKSIEKSQHTKKVNLTKKKITKPQKLNGQIFQNLPPEDVEFIKNLDKQFKLHGDNIKFKIERLNGTTKNSKRTIDGELGYGYQTQNFDSGYQFSQPKYVFYPYSQHNIPAVRQTYGNTAISVQPSQAYEIKEEPTAYGPGQQYFLSQNSHSGGYVPYVDQYYTEPVIVLRIPGPAKYASHLQHLLQQYLEIRAGQYLKALQQSEAQHQHDNSYQQQYHSETPASAYGQPSYQHKPIDQVYQNLQYQQQQQKTHQQQYQGNYEPQYENVAEHAQSSDGQGQAYDYSDIGGHASLNEYGQYDESSYSNYQSPIYDYSTEHETSSSHATYGAPPAHSDHNEYSNEKSDIPISENYPSHTHTKVVFTNAGSHDHSTSYPLPPIPNVPKYHNTRQGYDYTDSNNYNEEKSAAIAIKPRTFNYHPHLIAGKGLKRNTSTKEEQYMKLNKLISRLKTREESQSSSESEA